MSRRPSISVNNYPEHLNPFYENDSTYQPIKESNDNKENKDTNKKESKNKFWTFGRSRKKRTGAFSIKATWNDLFGKNKNANAFAECRVTAASTSQKNELNLRPYASCRFTPRDQKEFDEAIGTLARRRKYAYDDSTRSSSSMTVNGSPKNIQDESVNESDFTPKPPVRSKFGQASPTPTNKIPTLSYEDKEQNQTLSKLEHAPLPPKRTAVRASQRRSPPIPAERKELTHSSARDENENVSEDCYIFKRCHQDPVRMSNLSISSCISVTSTTSAYTRKKRRAPPPPKPKEMLETTKENEVRQICETSKVEVKIIEPATSCDEKKKSKKLHEVNPSPDEETQMNTTNKITMVTEKVVQLETTKNDTESTENQDISTTKLEVKSDKNSEDESFLTTEEINKIETEVDPTMKLKPNNDSGLTENSEIIIESKSECLSIKDEIKKIEQQIKELEAKSSSELEPVKSPRKHIEEDRRTFFKNYMNVEENGVDVQLKELPRVQNECEIINLNDTLIESQNKESVKVIELHIEEPIKCRPDIRTKRSRSFTFEKKHSVEIEFSESKGSKLSL